MVVPTDTSRFGTYFDKSTYVHYSVLLLHPHTRRCQCWLANVARLSPLVFALSVARSSPCASEISEMPPPRCNVVYVRLPAPVTLSTCLPLHLCRSTMYSSTVVSCEPSSFGRPTGVTIDEFSTVSMAHASFNTIIGAGLIERGGDGYLLRVDGMFRW